MTKIVHCRRERYDILIDRTTKWGNPFIIGKDGTRAEVIEMYEEWIRKQKDLIAALPELKDKTLGCWCAPNLLCHGSILIKLLDELENKKNENN